MGTALRLVCIGNPIRAEGRFVDLIRQADRDRADNLALRLAVKAVRIPSTESPHVHLHWMEPPTLLYQGNVDGPNFILAEIDYLLTSRLGVDAALDFLDSVERGAFALVPPSLEDIVRCRELIVQYRDLNVGLADASVVATAERLGIQRLLTVDQRHFRAITPRHLSHFIILPADAH